MSTAESKDRAGADDVPLYDASADSFVQRAGPRLYQQAVLLEGSVERGQDLYREMVARLLSRWPELSDVSSIDAYAYRTLLNTHRDSWRRSRRIDRRSEADSGAQDDGSAPVLAPRRSAARSGRRDVQPIAGLDEARIPQTRVGPGDVLPPLRVVAPLAGD